MREIYVEEELASKVLAQFAEVITHGVAVYTHKEGKKVLAGFVIVVDSFYTIAPIDNNISIGFLIKNFEHFKDMVRHYDNCTFKQLDTP